MQDKDTGVTTAYLLGCYIKQQNADIAGGFASAYIWQIFLNIFTWTIMFIAVAILLYYLLAHAVIVCELSDFSHKAK